MRSMHWLTLIFFAFLTQFALAQVPLLPQTCEEKLATAEKTSLVLRDDRERWQQQFVTVWQRAEKAEAEVARLQDEIRKAEREQPPAPNGKGTN